MDINVLKRHIDNLNAQVVQLNQQRQQNIGKRDALQSQISQMIETYKSTYGVALTEENIDMEIERLTAETTEKCNKLSEAISAITAMDYDRANELLGVGKKDTEVAPKVASNAVPDVSPIQQVDTIVQQVTMPTPVSSVQVTAPISTVTPMPVEEPMSSVSPVSQVQPFPKKSVIYDEDDFIDDTPPAPPLSFGGMQSGKTGASSDRLTQPSQRGAFENGLLPHSEREPSLNANVGAFGGNSSSLPSSEPSKPTVSAFPSDSGGLTLGSIAPPVQKKMPATFEAMFGGDAFKP